MNTLIEPMRSTQLLNLLKVTIFVLIPFLQTTALANTTCRLSSSGLYELTNPNNGRVFQLTAVTAQQAQELHRASVQQKTLAYFRNNLELGRCIETANEVNHWLSEQGILGLRANVQTENGGFVGATGASFLDGGADDGNVFMIDSIFGDKTYTWGHHVAIALCVVESRGDSQGEIYVLDPSTLTQTSPLEIWRDQLISTLPNPLDTSSWSLSFY